MSNLLLFAAALIGDPGNGLGNAYRNCIESAAMSVLRSKRTDAEVADYALAECRHFEPRLKEAFTRVMRTSRTGVVSPPSELDHIFIDDQWPKTLKTHRLKLISDVRRARQYLQKQ